MPKSGRLSIAEKYEIQGRLQEHRKDGTAEEEALDSIAAAMDRRVSIVQKYVTEELNNIQETIAKVAEEKAKPVLKVPKDMFNDAVAKVEAQGMVGPDAKELVRKAVKKISKWPTTADAIFGLAMSGLKAKHVMGKRTVGGKSGVSVMTPAANARLDEARKNIDSNKSRSARGNIFRPSDGQII